MKSIALDLNDRRPRDEMGDCLIKMSLKVLLWERDPGSAPEEAKSVKRTSTSLR
jgi:hypothetical protein